MDELWQKISEWLWALLLPLLWYVKHTDDKRVLALEIQLNAKAEKEEQARLRGHIEKLFEQDARLERIVAETASDIRKDMNGGFQRITEIVNAGNVQILHELAKKADR